MVVTALELAGAWGGLLGLSLLLLLAGWLEERVLLVGSARSIGPEPARQAGRGAPQPEPVQPEPVQAAPAEVEPAEVEPADVAPVEVAPVEVAPVVAAPVVAAPGDAAVAAA